MKCEITPIEKAINAVNGNKSQLARLVGCSPSNITNIVARGGRIPYRSKDNRDRWVAATGLSKEILFPDIYWNIVNDKPKKIKATNAISGDHNTENL